MKILCIDDIDKSICGNFSASLINDNYYFEVYYDVNKSLKETLSDYESFKECMECEIDSAESFYEDDEEEMIDVVVDTWEKFEKNFDNIIDYVDYIACDSFELLDEVLDKNPELRNKNILLPANVKITDYENINILKNKYKSLKNVYVYLEGNDAPVRLDECTGVMNQVEDIANLVLKLNLSPLENYMFVYDIVRQREYKEETGDDLTASRDLKKILSGDEIVCSGFARLYKGILEHMGLNCDYVCISSKNNEHEAHARNGAYICDPKYNIDGYYYFDTTWDSKGNNKKYLNTYNCFLKTRDEMEELENYSYSYHSSEEYSKVLECNLKHVIENKDKGGLIRYIRTINTIYKKNYNVDENLIDFKKVMLSFDEFFENCDINLLLYNIHRCLEDFNKPVYAETFLELVNNVRRVESELNEDLFDYSLDVIKDIYMRSNFAFNKKYYTEDDLYAVIFGEKERIVYTRSELFDNYINETEKFVEDTYKFTKKRKKN